MNFFETINTAVKALNSNKTRSFLTMLGVIIGVFAVVTLVALGKGVENYVTGEFNSLGANLLFVSPGSGDFQDDPAKSYSRNKLSEKHIDLIRTHASEYITEVTPNYYVGHPIEYKGKSYFSEIIGSGHEGADMFNYPINKGRQFNKAEERGKSRVIVIGPEVQKNLFGSRDPIGERVNIKGDSYEVIGVFREKGQNYDSGAIIPHTALEETFDLDKYSAIIMEAKDELSVDRAMRQVELALLRDLSEDEFEVLSQKDILDQIQGFLGMMTVAISAIAAISLVVGGIGIMNIMLVSVTERIREIGLRKALGATPANIALQFIIESVMLSLGGGFFGLLLAGVATIIAQNYFEAEITLVSVLVAAGFSIVVGVIFGTYPAVDASRKDPITALRYE